MQIEGNETETVIDTTQPTDGEGGQAVDRGDNFTPTEDEGGAPVIAAVAEPDDKATKQPKADEKTDDKGEARIPKARFDEVNDRMKTAEAARAALEAELAELRKPKQPAEPEQPKQPAFDMDAKEEEYAAALAAGNAKGAAAIRRDINAEIKRQAVAEAETTVRESLSKRDAEKAFEKAISDSLEKYPFLDDRSDDANKEAIAEVVEWRDFYAAKGIPMHEALQKAVAKIGPQYEAKADPETPEPEKDPKDDKSNVRQIESVRRNAAAAGAQPPQLNGVGERASAAGRVDVSKMTEAQFDALPAAEKKRLRGD